MNESLQIDEIEALQAIYDEQFKLDLSPSSFSVDIGKNLTLFINFHSDYPSKAPPIYELLAPDLSKQTKDLIAQNFTEIFNENKGEPIIYQWIERLKEIVESNIEQTQNDSENKKQNDNLTKPRKEFNLDITHGPIIEDRKSIFQGHTCKIHSKSDVDDFIEFLMENKKIAQATHNISAYRIIKDNIILQDCNDDGETNAGKRLLHLLQLLKIENVVVVVSRWYGGIHLGPDRFKHINEAARQVLVQAGFLSSSK